MRWRLRQRRVFSLIGLLIVLLFTAAEARAHDDLVYVGTYTGKGSDGIYAFRFDPATGETRSLGLAGAMGKSVDFGATFPGSGITPSMRSWAR